jgi:hypothetical protein
MFYGCKVYLCVSQWEYSDIIIVIEIIAVVFFRSVMPSMVILTALFITLKGKTKITGKRKIK